MFNKGRQVNFGKYSRFENKRLKCTSSLLDRITNALSNQRLCTFPIGRTDQMCYPFARLESAGLEHKQQHIGSANIESKIIKTYLVLINQ